MIMQRFKNHYFRLLICVSTNLIFRKKEQVLDLSFKNTKEIRKNCVEFPIDRKII